jgi:LPXTG-site transpeptidase (sortase) family protein
MFSSLFAALFLGSMTTFAASDSNLTVAVRPIANKNLPVMAGGSITYFYQIQNTGRAPIKNIKISDDKCSLVTYDAVGQDINVNHKLDKGELWSYYCTISATSSVTNVVSVTGNVNGTEISASAASYLNVPDPVDRANDNGVNGGGTSDSVGSGRGSGKVGVPGKNGVSGKTLKGMPNTGLGGKINKKQVAPSSEKNNEVGTLKIPSLGTNAKIETVGLNANGNMDVPANDKSVGWYKFGPQPGEAGSAVLAGHVDTYAGTSGVFKDLDKLKVGDEVDVVNMQNETIHFAVDRIEVYDEEEAPLKSIFGYSDGEIHLNLITCAGAWDNRSHRYTQRLVVYTSLVR